MDAAMDRTSDGVEMRRGARRRLLMIFVPMCALALVFGAGSAVAATPEVKTDPTVVAGFTSVQFSGEVNPNGDPLIWLDQISTDEGGTWREGFEFGEAPLGEIVEESELNTSHQLTNLVQTGLTPGTTYRVRLAVFDVTTNELVGGPGVEFTTKAPPAPSVTLDPITTTTDTTAVFKGKVDPNSPGGLSEEEKTFYATEYTFHCTPECPGLSGSSSVPAEATGSEMEVEAHAVKLEPNREYTVTLSATNSGRETTGGPQAFTTHASPPTVATGPGTSKTPGTFTIEGTVNPHNTAITGCVFEWGPTASYGHVLPCEPMPAGGNTPVFVEAGLSGLTIGSEYHFRIVASNGVGLPVATTDTTFVAHDPCPNEAIREEQGSTYLPECRAYEQVTPVFKEGFVPVFTHFTDDSTVTWTTNGNYANNGNGTAGLAGGNPYLADRTESGWSTESLSPSGPDYYTPLISTQVPPAAISSDARSLLWVMRRGNESDAIRDFYIRRPDGVFTRIGSALDPLAPNSSTTDILASADLSHVAFKTAHGVYEYVGVNQGQPTRVDVDNADHPLSPPCAASFGGTEVRSRAMSEDGHVIFFSCGSAIYARVGGTTTVAVSASQCTRVCSEGSPPSFRGADADGTRVYFMTSAQLLDGDTDETSDLYECDIPPGTVSPVGSVNACPHLREVSGAAPGADVQGVTGVSEDGSRAYFVATGILATNPSADGATAVQGDDNLYVWHQNAANPGGQTRFVAKLDRADGPPLALGGLWGPDAVGRVGQMSADGRYLVFETYAPLIDEGPQADLDQARDVYRYDADAGELTRLSTDASGVGGNDPGKNAVVTPIAYSPTAAPGAPYARATMSDDGGSVVFVTSEALAANDTNGTPDSYLWHQGRVSLISSGKPSEDGFLGLPVEGGGMVQSSVQAYISPSGHDVYFTTSARLLPSDVDTVMDIYDARIGGGFVSSKAAPCTDESCRSQTSPPPARVPPATQGAGAGNPPTVRSCPKGKIKRHGRCVKKHKKKHSRVKHRHPAKHRHARYGSAKDNGGPK